MRHHLPAIHVGGSTKGALQMGKVQAAKQELQMRDQLLEHVFGTRSAHGTVIVELPALRRLAFPQGKADRPILGGSSTARL